MSDELTPRLENWGLCLRDDHWHRGHCRSIEHKYSPERGLEALEAKREPKPYLDYRDAEIVEAAWRKVSDRKQQQVLRLVYIWRAPSHFVCRRLRIVNDKNGIAFRLELGRAERAIGRLLELPRSTIESPCT